MHVRVMLVHRERRELSKRTWEKSRIRALGVSVCEFVSMGEVKGSARNGTAIGTHTRIRIRTHTNAERASSNRGRRFIKFRFQQTRLKFIDISV